MANRSEEVAAVIRILRHAGRVLRARMGIPPLRRARWRQLTIDTAAVVAAGAAVTVLIALIRQHYDAPTVVMLYLFPVLGLAAMRGSGPAVAVASLGVLVYSWFLAEPVYNLGVADVDEVLALMLLLATAVVTGHLASTLRRRAEEAAQRAAALAVLYDVTRAISGEPDGERVLASVACRVAEAFRARGCAIFLADESGRLSPRSAVGAAPQPADLPAELFGSGIVVEGSGPAPVGGPPVVRSAHMPGARCYAVPLVLRGRPIGALAVVHGPAETPGEEARSLLHTIGEKVALALEREALQREAGHVHELRQSDALKSALLSSVSHDLRSPLAAIKTTATALLQGDLAVDRALTEEFVHTIVDQTERLDRLVGNLLSLSRIEAGALRPDLELHTLPTLVYDVLAGLEAVTAQHRLVVDLPCHLPPVELDYVQMSQVVSNLIENAVKYSPPGTTIRIVARARRDEVRITVEDEGAGIPPAHRDRVFERFYRVDDGRCQGLGIGLAICRGIVEAHGGRIWAESGRSGHGTLIRLTLPRAAGGLPLEDAPEPGAVGTGAGR